MSTNGLTSVINDSIQGQTMRSAATAVEATLKKSTRFAPVSVAELTSWTKGPGYTFAAQDSRHQLMVQEEYAFQAIRDAVFAGEPVPSIPALNKQFDKLDVSTKNQVCDHTATTQAAIAYGVWAVVTPFYINERTKFGNRSHYWTSIPQHSLVPKTDDERMRYMCERDFSVEGDAAAQGASSSQTTRSVASTYTRAMWLATTVLGREPHPISAVRPLTEREWYVIAAHGVPEDMLVGNKVPPPLNYATLAPTGTEFRPCKEFLFLQAITEGAFYSNIFMPTVYFALRARKLADECKELGVDKDEMCRKVFLSTNENTIASFNNNLASVYGSLKKSGDDRFRPDAMDIAAIRSYLPEADLTALEASGQALSYSVQKYLNVFREDFLCTRRKMRADVEVKRALDRGGLECKRAAGKIPAGESDNNLRGMMSSLVGQVWDTVWARILQPWLTSRKLSTDARTFMLITEAAAAEGGLVQFADIRRFTKHDAERLLALVLLHLSVLRSQVTRDSVVEEYHLEERDNIAFYTFKMTRAFKTAACKGGEGMPHLSKWELSELESMMVHTLKVLCRPLLSIGVKETSKMFLDVAGKPVTQRWIEGKFSQIGKTGTLVCKDDDADMSMDECIAAKFAGFTAPKPQTFGGIRLPLLKDILRTVKDLGGGDGGKVFKVLVHKRRNTMKAEIAAAKNWEVDATKPKLEDSELWFKYDVTWFTDKHERFFKRVVTKNAPGFAEAQEGQLMPGGDPEMGGLCEDSMEPEDSDDDGNAGGAEGDSDEDSHDAAVGGEKTEAAELNSFQKKLVRQQCRQQALP
ncbi:hypothetical protein JKP88DRAFT_247627 [Tribonema minus]|uniref:Uncharacterized protein n=1 Tax=Tribonema minus TaxID=303371 RepID=A0A835YXZ5_9STRA|nr:hypothetical protein JKP88DRAFT_247627 [Tribonema minus]